MRQSKAYTSELVHLIRTFTVGLKSHDVIKRTLNLYHCHGKCRWRQTDDENSIWQNKQIVSKRIRCRERWTLGPQDAYRRFVNGGMQPVTVRRFTVPFLIRSYHPCIVSIWLKQCWKRHKTLNHHRNRMREPKERHTAWTLPKVKIKISLRTCIFWTGPHIARYLIIVCE